MITFRFRLIAIGFLISVSACDTDIAQDTSACRDDNWNTVCPVDGHRDGTPPTLTAEQQANRTQMCMGEIQIWRDRGVWVHGGVEPAVSRDAWRELDDSEKNQIADIAACIASAGTFEPQEVQIVSEGFKVPVEKIGSDNQLFAERFGAQSH